MMSTIPALTEAQQRDPRTAPSDQWNAEDGHNRSTSDNKYSKNYLQTAKSLTKAQLALGVIITALQIITTTLDDNFQRTAAAVLFANDASIDINSFGDIYAAGIWAGSMMISAAAIGISGYRRQSRCLITTHLVFNTLVLPLTVVAIGLVSSVIDQLNFCKDNGEYFSKYDGPYNTQVPLVFYGQILEGSSGNFHCFDVIFSLWSALDGLILAGCIVQFIVTVILVVFNSVAVCRCCRRCCICCRSINATNFQPPYRPLTADIERSQQPTAQPLWQNQVMVQGAPPQPQHLTPAQTNYPANFSPQPRPQEQFPPTGPAQLSAQTSHTTTDGQLPQN